MIFKEEKKIFINKEITCMLNSQYQDFYYFQKDSEKYFLNM